MTGTDGANGVTGTSGPNGTAGTNGTTGTNGAKGATGTDGTTGANGVTGTNGTNGTTGANGVTGTSGANGTTGAAGATGQAGATGPAGATGSTGPNGLSQYAYVYNLESETVAIDEDVPFDHNGTMSAGITHAAGTAGITLEESGIYAVTFSVSGTEPNQMGLFLDGVMVPGTVYGSGAGTQQNTGQGLFYISAGQVLTVRNHSSSAAVGLASTIGGTQANTNASLTIEKLN